MSMINKTKGFCIGKKAAQILAIKYPCAICVKGDRIILPNTENA